MVIEVFQVLVNFNDKKNEPLTVAESKEEFNNTTILELKKKFKSNFPGAPDPDDVWVIFGKDTLEDHHTLQHYKIKPLSVLLIVMQIPDGEDSSCVPEDGDKGMSRTDSKEILFDMEQTEPESFMM